MNVLLKHRDHSVDRSYREIEEGSWNLKEIKDKEEQKKRKKMKEKGIANLLQEN